MIGFDLSQDMPVTARYHREAIEQIVSCVEERSYCAVLGPRLCGKTILLRFVEGSLARLLSWTCVYVDLQELRATTQQAFFADLIYHTARRLEELTGQHLSLPEESLASGAVFRAFLAESLEALERDVVLIIDPLEALPTDLNQALLTSLRAAYMDQQTMDHQVTVVVSGALGLATLAVGESSPFRGIARRVFVGDLSDEDSLALIRELLGEHGVAATRPALDRMLQATRGDLFLIRKISQCCVDQVSQRRNRRVRSRDVSLITQRFLRDEVLNYAPLLEAVRLIEEDPDLLQCILVMLREEGVHRSALPLPLSPDLDPLYLTGVVEQLDGDRYRLQNTIYRHFLTGHFNPGRVGHVLAMSGRWDSAIDYLEDSIRQGNQQSRADLLPATINSIFASQDLSQAVHFLRRGLSAAFGLRDTQFWFSPPQEDHLRLVGSSLHHPTSGANPLSQTLVDGLPAVPKDQTAAPGEVGLSGTQIAITADRLETRAFRQRVPLRGQEGAQRVVRAIPLSIPGQKPVGVVTIYDELGGEGQSEQRERDLQLTGFLNQAARALQTVSVRRQELTLAGRVQASLLPLTPPSLSGWQISAIWRPARETSGDFYDFIPLPGGRLALVIADVVDKGMGAALLMALSRTLIRSYAADYPDEPEHLLQVVNRRIISDIDAGLFVTLFYGVLDPHSGMLTYCNGGHPPPHIVTGGQAGAREALFRTGIPLGISEDALWERAIIQLPAGGLLLLYTDGVLEAQNTAGEFYGESRMLEVVGSHLDRPVGEIQDAIISDVYAFAGTEPQVDDITLMVLARQTESAA
ncbi:MAG: SpoIIE family protein phosphatase [Anaerolineales bacterium]